MTIYEVNQKVLQLKRGKAPKHIIKYWEKLRDKKIHLSKQPVNITWDI